MGRNTKNKKTFIPSRTSPTGSSRACLCWDTNKYSIECCDGSMQAQGIGVITRTDWKCKKKINNRYINNMKSTEMLNQIKTLLNIEVKLEEMKLENGTIVSAE